VRPIVALAVMAIPLLSFSPVAMAEEWLVVQKGRAYMPETLTAHVGDRVVFSNEDDVTHNVYSDSKAAVFDLGAQKPGEKATIVLQTPGIVDVECEIHPKMHLLIDVK
jgi:plastocyanin